MNAALLPATEDESKDSAPMLPPTMERDVHDDGEDEKGGDGEEDVEMTPDGGVGDEVLVSDILKGKIFDRAIQTYPMEFWLICEIKCMSFWLE